MIKLLHKYNLLSKSNILRNNFISSRSYASKEPKKFFKNVTTSQTIDGDFEINLDGKKLRTPGQNLFTVPNEPLALAIAQEWDSQSETIKRPTMHLTTLCNTAIDNPTKRSPDRIIKGIMEYLDTDTIRFHTSEQDDLLELQQMIWDPVLRATEERYNLPYKSLPATTGMFLPCTSPELRDQMSRHIRGYNTLALAGFQTMTETLKSFVLALSLADRVLKVDEAVKISRLEVEYQIRHWGSVPWHHDVENVELKARVAAGLLLVHTGHERRHRVTMKFKNSVT